MAKKRVGVAPSVIERSFAVTVEVIVSTAHDGKPPLPGPLLATLAELAQERVALGLQPNEIVSYRQVDGPVVGPSSREYAALPGTQPWFQVAYEVDVEGPQAKSPQHAAFEAIDQMRDPTNLWQPILEVVNKRTGERVQVDTETAPDPRIMRGAKPKKGSVVTLSRTVAHRGSQGVVRRTFSRGRGGESGIEVELDGRNGFTYETTASCVDVIEHCDGCGGTGIRPDAHPSCGFVPPKGYVIVERCDACDRYSNDLAAARVWGTHAVWAKHQHGSIKSSHAVARPK